MLGPIYGLGQGLTSPLSIHPPFLLHHLPLHAKFLNYYFTGLHHFRVPIVGKTWVRVPIRNISIIVWNIFTNKSTASLRITCFVNIPFCFLFGLKGAHIHKCSLPHPTSRAHILYDYYITFLWIMKIP